MLVTVHLRGQGLLVIPVELIMTSGSGFGSLALEERGNWVLLR